LNEQRIEAIRAALEKRFNPEYLDVEDESHLHEGHAGARSGKGHFRVTIIAAAFEGQTRLQRHQAVFSAIDDLMETDIHALSIRPMAPGEL
jgi:BolA protein